MDYPPWGREKAIALLIVVPSALVGVAIDRLPLGSLARSVLATVAAWNLGLFFVTLAWQWLSPDAGESDVLPAPGRQFLLATGLAIGMAIVAYAAIAWIVGGGAPGLLGHPAVPLAVLGGIAGTVQAWIVWGSRELDPE